MGKHINLSQRIVIESSLNNKEMVLIISIQNVIKLKKHLLFAMFALPKTNVEKIVISIMQKMQMIIIEKL